jgi:hypothetical protein
MLEERCKMIVFFNRGGASMLSRNGTVEQHENNPIQQARSSRRSLPICMSSLALLMLTAACSSNGELGPSAIAGKTPDGTVEIQQVQIAYIGSGSRGSGLLNYRGRTYPFSIGGLGLGGIGASTIEATGEVYDLPEIARFPGIYGQGRYGFAIGRRSAGDLWLQNEAGVIMHLKAQRTGLILSLGGDAVRVAMDQ